MVNILGARLRRLRFGKSVREAARDLGITRASYAYYEGGERSPNVETLVKIANYYNVSLDYLAGISDVKSRENAEIAYHEGYEAGQRDMKVQIMHCVGGNDEAG